VLIVVTAVLVALGFLCTGCGTSGRETDAAAVVQRFQTALADRDGAAACAELGDETSSKLEQDEGHPCEQAIVELGLPAGGVPAGTSVHVTSAMVSLREGASLFLDEGPDGWEISAAGCRATGPDAPYDCDLES
jgi:hypothetical protein